MQLLNPNVKFVPTLIPFKGLPGRFYRPVGTDDFVALKNTVGVIVPFRSEAEAYVAKKEKPQVEYMQAGQYEMKVDSVRPDPNALALSYIVTLTPVT